MARSPARASGRSSRWGITSNLKKLHVIARLLVCLPVIIGIISYLIRYNPLMGRRARGRSEFLDVPESKNALNFREISTLSLDTISKVVGELSLWEKSCAAVTPASFNTQGVVDRMALLNESILFLHKSMDEVNVAMPTASITFDTIVRLYKCESSALGLRNTLTDGIHYLYNSPTTENLRLVHLEIQKQLYSHMLAIGVHKNLHLLAVRQEWLSAVLPSPAQTRDYEEATIQLLQCQTILLDLQETLSFLINHLRKLSQMCEDLVMCLHAYVEDTDINSFAQSGICGPDCVDFTYRTLKKMSTILYEFVPLSSAT